MDAAQLVKEAFPNQAFASFEAACKFINIAYQTGRHQLMAGTFPLSTTTVGKKRVVPIPVLIQFLQDKLAECGVGTSQETAIEVVHQPVIKKRRPGRPRKMEVQS